MLPDTGGHTVPFKDKQDRGWGGCWTGAGLSQHYYVAGIAFDEDGTVHATGEIIGR